MKLVSQEDYKKAMSDIKEIIEIYEDWNEFKDGGAAYECWSQVINILRKDGWIK